VLQLSRAFLLACFMLLISVSPFTLAFAQATTVSFIVNLNWFSLQVTYPAAVMPGDTISVSVQATPKGNSIYLQILTATVYYADETGLHQITTQALLSNPANGYGFHGSGSFSKSFTVSVPQNASRTSLVAVFSETVQSSYYALHYGYGPYYGYGWYPYYSYRTRTDDAIAPLSYIKATTPEYVSLQSTYQMLQRQLNQTQAQLKESQALNQQLQNTVSQENATINRLNQQLASANRMKQTYQLLALALGILALVLAVFSVYQWRAKEKANRLEAALTEASGKLNSAQTRIRDLESKLAESISKADTEARIAELQARLSESKSDLDALKEKLAGLESRTAEAERDLEAAKSRIRDLEASMAQV
jgi:peptidoglycan hydrolase CwlO-like protein